MTSRTDSDHPDESCDDVAAQQSLDELEKLLASVDPTDRYLFELNKGGLPVDPSAKSVVAHASHLGLSAALVESLGRRARLMAWPKRRGRIVTQEELSVLMNIPEDDVRITSRLAFAFHYRTGRHHWSAPPRCVGCRSLDSSSGWSAAHWPMPA